MSKLIILASCLVGALLVSDNAAAFTDSWVNFGAQTHHVFNRDGVTWGLLVAEPSGTLNQGVHVHEANVQVSTNPNIYEISNNTTAAVISVVDMDGAPVMEIGPGATTTIDLQNFHWDLLYGPFNPVAGDVVTMKTLDAAFPNPGLTFTVDLGGARYGTPSLSTVIHTFVGPDVELTEGLVVPVDPHNFGASIMSMGFVPEPGSISLVAIGACCLVAHRRRRLAA